MSVSGSGKAHRGTLAAHRPQTGTGMRTGSALGKTGPPVCELGGVVCTGGAWYYRQWRPMHASDPSAVCRAAAYPWALDPHLLQPLLVGQWGEQSRDHLSQACRSEGCTARESMRHLNATPHTSTNTAPPLNRVLTWLRPKHGQTCVGIG